MWQFEVAGSLATMCCLVGFRVRGGALYVLMVPDSTVHAFMRTANEDAMNAVACKILVTDLFTNGKPHGKVDLAVRDAGERMAAAFTDKHLTSPALWEDLQEVQSAQQQQKLKDVMLKQAELVKSAKIKREQEEKSKQRKKKRKEEDRVRQHVAQQKRLTQAKEREAKKKLLKRTNAKRKRDRQVASRAKLEGTVQRKALDTLQQNHADEVSEQRTHTLPAHHTSHMYHHIFR